MQSKTKVLMIVAFENFRDEEFSESFNAYKNAGIDVTVASIRKGTAVGMFGTEIEIGTTLDEVRESDFDAVVFIGGMGTPSVRSNRRAVEIAKNSADRKVLAAICWAPTILAKAGVVKGRKVTVWNGDDAEYGTTTSKVMENAGAEFIDRPVVVDGNLITGNGPAAAAEFAKAVVAKLNEK